MTRLWRDCGHCLPYKASSERIHGSHLGMEFHCDDHVICFVYMDELIFHITFFINEFEFWYIIVLNNYMYDERNTFGPESQF